MTKDLQTLETTTSMHLDKNDIVAIGVAEAEKKIKNNIFACKQVVERFNIQISEEIEHYQKDIEKFLINKFQKRFNAIQKKVKALQLSLDAELVYSAIPLQSLREDMSYEQSNSVSINIIKTEPNGKKITVMHQKVPVSKTQKSIAQLIKDLESRKKDTLEQGIEWKRKQADIPALERQMKAQVARTEVSKHKSGKAMIAAMMDQLDESIALIG